MAVSIRVRSICLVLGLGIPSGVLGQSPPQTPHQAPHQDPAQAPTEAATPADEATPAAEATGGADASSAGIAADPAVLEEARGHFAQGVAFAEAGNCNGAIGEFLAAHRLIPRANALYNVAQCQERLFRYGLAIQYYERYLAEAAADAPDRPAVEAALRTLGNLLATLDIAANAKAEVWVDDRLAGEAPGEVLVPAGGHTIELRAKGFLPGRREVRVVGREEISLSFTLEKARTTVRVTETTGLSPLVFWSGLTATVVSAGLGTVFAIDLGDIHSRGTSLPAEHPERGRLQEDAESAQLTADIFFGTSLVLGVATVVVGLLTDWDGSAEDKAGPTAPTQGDGAAQTARWRLRPLAGTTQAGLRLEGQL